MDNCTFGCNIQKCVYFCKEVGYRNVRRIKHGSNYFDQEEKHW